MPLSFSKPVLIEDDGDDEREGRGQETNFVSLIETMFVYFSEEEI